MPKFDNCAKLGLITAIIFVLIGCSQTYKLTEGIFGNMLGGGMYANGNTLSNRGFLLHAVVAGLLMWLICKYQLKL
jgi:hypothetical protein